MGGEAVPLSWVFMGHHVDFKLRCDGSAIPVIRLRSSLCLHHWDGRLLISIPVADRVFRARVWTLRRSIRFMGADLRMAASVLSHGAFSPHAWAKASSKGSNPCGTFLSLAPRLRTRTPLFPDRVG